MSDVRVTDELYPYLDAANVVKRYKSAGAAGERPFEEQLKRGSNGLAFARLTS